VARGRAFFAPLTVDHFADLLLAHPRATILAGGTDVGLWVTKQHRELDTIVYSGRVAELCALEKGEEYLEIGAAVSLTDAMPMILSHYPAFGEVFTRFASPPIRNAGTLGGNIANGSPIGDSMPLLLAVDTLLFLRKGSARRTMALSDFYSGYQQTALSESEFIERIRIPLPARTDVIAGYKISKRFDQDISAVCAGFRLRLAAGKVDDIRLAFGGMAEIPRRALHCEQTLAGAEWNAQTVSQAAAALAEDFTPISDMRSSAAYRMQVCQNLLLRFFHESTGNAPTRVYQYGR
jgi:xanthine dehydrogenase small subunit